ncbi:YeeE/YedE family protein [Orrella sp. JC864]|uniref:YeeE/YedE family protein n=1 Tax=Orrella sp. JC864 TaxID=3120298 RepID=UPI00300979D4
MAAVFIWSRYLAAQPGDGRLLAFSLLSGAAFGAVLQRSRFCFLCITRDFLHGDDARGLLGLLAALAVGTLGYHALFGAFLPIPASPRLPPGAHIGPVSWVLALGAAVFGLGMAISGSCISAHLYRLGEGSLASPFALLGAGLGFVLGFASWNFLYLAAIQQAPVLWLPHHLGYGGSALLQLLLLGALAAWLLRRHRAGQPQAAPPPTGLRQALLGPRWPAYVGGILVGFIGVLAYLRAAPLGVTAELGSLARTAAAAQGWLPARLQGLDGFAGCATAIKQTLWSHNGLFVLALVAGAWASALAAGEFRPRAPGLREIARNLAGGVLMGWGAMVALGCTVGTLLSGIMAGALSGWLFGLFCLAGIWLGLSLRGRAQH